MYNSIYSITNLTILRKCTEITVNKKKARGLILYRHTQTYCPNMVTIYLPALDQFI